MTDTGWLSPSTIAEVNHPIGTVGWNNENNAKTDDGSYADAQNLVAASNGSEYLQATNFGATIPSSAIITGIEVKVNRYASISAGYDNEIKLVKGGSIGGDNKSTSSTWATSEEWKSFGGDGILWGLAFTPSDINASNFGWALQATGFLNVDLFVDVMQVKIYYTSGLDIDDVSGVPEINDIENYQEINDISP